MTSICMTYHMVNNLTGLSKCNSNLIENKRSSLPIKDYNKVLTLGNKTSLCVMLQRTHVQSDVTQFLRVASVMLGGDH